MLNTSKSLLLSYIRNERIGISVLFIRREVLTLNLFPLLPIHYGKERIGILKRLMNTGDIHLVGTAQSLAIDQRSSDNEHLLFMLAQVQRVMHGLAREAIHEIFRHRGQHHIFPLRKRTVRKGFERFASHNNRMTGGQLLEMLHISRQMPQQLLVLAYRVDCWFLPIALLSDMAAIIEIFIFFEFLSL